MGRDKIRHLVYLHGRWRWCPSKSARAHGFKMINLTAGLVIDGQHVPSAVDKTRAIELNEAWDRARRGIPDKHVLAHRYPAGSIGDGYMPAMRLREAERAAKGLTWSTEQRSRDDWPRAWRWIEPLFGDVIPKTVKAEHLIGDPSRPEMIGLRPLVATKVSESEAHRTIKVWRALWAKMAVFGFCDASKDPSFLFENSAPKPRQAVWLEAEAVRLCKQAWRSGYHGLASLLAVAWDSQLSPVDTRQLQIQQMRRDRFRLWFEVSRSKTGRAAVATLTRRTVRLLEAYHAMTPVEAVGAAPVFRNRSWRHVHERPSRARFRGRTGHCVWSWGGPTAAGFQEERDR
jgi:hypothetical protein